ncbi:hypothetical protein [Propionicicella superfundia]|uniref:hypothetical protein n=1 Tax=Propionicicella superfundia TaxID=348582 RepID=UPI0003F6A9D3|nr:hypothetical protein [Propionicicella superfundia]
MSSTATRDRSRSRLAPLPPSPAESAPRALLAGIIDLSDARIALGAGGSVGVRS